MAETYCNNCDTEATHVYTTERGSPFYLCTTCTEAFELGQVNHGNDSLQAIDEDKERFAIQSTSQSNLFWSNEFGWTCFEDCDEFEEKDFNLPLDGQWVNAADFDDAAGDADA